jgi:eukaryotic-like serine/threonine-protein kinase
MVAANTNANTDASTSGSSEVVRDSGLTAGSTVGDRFTLVRQLGRGAMGTVWLARHLALDIDVALKFIDSSLSAHPNYVERFRREARAAAQIHSPHVVNVLDYGTDERGFPFMAMEYLSGMTLGTFLTENPRPRVEVVARIVTHAARGLARAHELGIIHRDIKPENLFLCGDGNDDNFQLKILDFGVAKGTFTASGHGTLAGQLVGSPAYMSPEQARGYKSIDHRADLFSLGVVAYQCLTGWHPFTGAGLGELLLSVCTLDPEPPTALMPGLPLAVDDWFEKALAKKRSERFASAREMSLAFCDALGPFVPARADTISSYPQAGLKTVVTVDGRSEHVSGIVPLGRPEPAPRTVREEAPIPATTRSSIQPTSIAEAFTPLAHIPHVLGLALLDAKGECLLLAGREPNARQDAAIFAHARTVAETVESIHEAVGATHLGMRFEHMTVYVRWMSSFALVVRGEASMRALLLTVGSNKLAGRLESIVAQLGGADPVARLLGGSGHEPAPPRDRALATALTVKLTAKRPPGSRPPLGSSDSRPTQRPVAHLPESPTKAPTGEASYEWAPEEVPTKRERPLVYRGRVVGSKWEGEPQAEAPEEAQATVPPITLPEDDLEQTRDEPPAKRERLILYRGQVLSGKKAEEKPKERVRIYRGKVLDE